MAEAPAYFTVFFAWQSEALKANRQVIEASLRLAASRVEGYFAERGKSLQITIDKDISGRTGSQAIADEILRKIYRSDAFVGDISIVNAEYASDERLSPNTNVVLEAGYAAASLGWDRVVLVFNKACGYAPTKLPFDLRHRSVIQYNRSETESRKQKYIAEPALTARLEVEIRNIFDKIPSRPAELAALSEENVKKRRDIENLSWLLRSVHWPTVEDYIATGHLVRTGSLIYMFDEFEAIIASTYFHLYDDGLRTRVESLAKAWRQAMAGDEHYEPSRGGGWRYVFTTDRVRGPTKTEMAAINRINAAIRRLRPQIDNLLAYVRKDYPAVDVEALSEEALARQKRQLDRANRLNKPERSVLSPDQK
jgi:hypothetical protein